ncbi:uncharacterized protein LOC143293647 [Babylonia areolata]|uniref:uncharacterized protein LOC143293647 n=1 Tax=Babylonia areolata TaxID=304850 RepID=UPI003FD5E5CE
MRIDMRNPWSVLPCVIVCLLLPLLLLIDVQVNGLGCFKCTSINHTNPDCEDRFNNTDKRFWDGDCWAYRKKREGMFPATQCIKMTAEDDETGYSVVVRNCVVDDGGTNSETEIGRLTHCGWLNKIEYNRKRMRGCILACDTDGCNAATLPPSLNMNFRLIAILCAITTFLSWTRF